MRVVRNNADELLITDVGEVVIHAKRYDLVVMLGAEWTGAQLSPSKARLVGEWLLRAGGEITRK